MNTSSEIETMLAANVFAVFGVSRSHEKYGYQAYRTLKMEGKKVYPVNPLAADIDGKLCYANAEDLPKDVQVAVLVTPPSASEQIVPLCLARGIKMIWLQPGADSPRVIALCQEADAMLVAGGPCIMAIIIEKDF